VAVGLVGVDHRPAVAHRGIGRFMSKLNINTENIESAIADFEKQVSFELVPVIAQKSSSRAHVVWILFFLFQLVALVKIDLIYIFDLYSLTVLNVIEYWLISIIFGLLFSLFLVRFDLVVRLFLLPEIRKMNVYRKAQQVYFEKKIFQTNAHDGMLLYISLLEKRIQIIVDPRSAFEGKVELSEAVLKILQENFKKNQHEKGLIDAIQYMKSFLIKHYPKKNADTDINELPNKLIWLND